MRVDSNCGRSRRLRASAVWAVVTSSLLAGHARHALADSTTGYTFNMPGGYSLTHVYVFAYDFVAPNGYENPFLLPAGTAYVAPNFSPAGFSVPVGMSAYNLTPTIGFTNTPTAWAMVGLYTDGLGTDHIVCGTNANLTGLSLGAVLPGGFGGGEAAEINWLKTGLLAQGEGVGLYLFGKDLTNENYMLPFGQTAQLYYFSNGVAIPGGSTTANAFGAPAPATWNTTISSGNWNSAANWLANAVPTNTDDVVIAFNDALTSHTITYNGSLSSNNALNIRNTGTGNVTLLLPNGFNLTAGYSSVGQAGQGQVNQSGGNFTLQSYLAIGAQSASTGLYNFSGGSLYVTGAGGGETAFYVGDSGTGSFVHTGGVATISTPMYVGYAIAGTGSYSLSATGSLIVQNSEHIGYYGKGAFAQNGGTHTVTGDLTLASNAGAIGSYTLSAGALNISGTNYIGGAGNASFTQTGGTQNAGYVQLGVLSGSSGAYNLSGSGLLAVSNNDYFGNAGYGIFNHTAGTHTVAGTLFLGYNAFGTGLYNLSGTGRLSVAGNAYLGGTTNGSSNNAKGILTVGTGGTATVGGAITVYFTNGTINLAGGTLNVGSSINAAPRDFNWTSGNLNLNTTGSGVEIVVDGNYLLGAALSLDSGKNLTIGSAAAPTADRELIALYTDSTVTQSGGTHTVYGGLWLADPAAPLTTINASYTLSGGSLLTTYTDVGVWGTAVFNQTGGTHTTTELDIGFLQTNHATGTYNLSGSGVLSVNGACYIDGDSAGAGQANDHGILNITTGGNMAVTGAMTIYNVPGAFVTLNGGSLSVGSLDTQSVAFAHFNWIAGTLTLNSGLAVDFGPFGTAPSLGTGKTLNVYNQGLFIGNTGTGTMTQTGSSIVNIGTPAVPESLYVGNNSGTRGYYNLGNSSALSVIAAEYIGVTGTGTFTQTGGTNSTNNGEEDLGYWSGSTGAYLQSAGSNSIGSGWSLNLGYNSGANGFYTLTGTGVANVSGGVYVGGSFFGQGGNGLLTINGGSMTVAGPLRVWNNSNTFVNFVSGSLTVGSLVTLPGDYTRFIWTGGTLKLTGTGLTLDSVSPGPLGSVLSWTGTQALVVGGGDLVIANTGNASLTASAPESVTVGAVAANRNLYLGFTGGATGNCTLSGTSNLTVNGNAYVGGTSTAPGGVAHLTINSGAAMSVTGITRIWNTTGTSLSINGSGYLDVNKGLLIFDSTSPNLATDYTTLRNYLSNNQIRSSSAFAITGLGFMKSSDYFTLHGISATFGGQSLTANDLLIKYTYLGDADFDGTITMNDYALLNAGFLLGNFNGNAGNNPAPWVHGDFNNDGLVNYLDFALIDNSFASQSGALANDMIAAHRAQFGAPYVLAIASLGTPVPEPGSLGLLALGSVGLLKRRRR